MSQPYTIRIFVPEGEPNGLRIIENVNWNGTGVVFPRDKWASALKHGNIGKAGVYVLWGASTETDDPRPRIYVGEGDFIPDRIEAHLANKDFWASAIVFTSASLNKAYVRYIESVLISLAKAHGRCLVENGTEPALPPMSASDKADTEGFLAQILRILPLVGLDVFEQPKKYVVPKSDTVTAATVAEALSGRVISPVNPTGSTDELTIVVPCREDGFRRVFLGEDCWYYVRIAPGKVSQIKWCAAYQANPVSAVTHIAPVARIELFGEHGEYKIVFASPAVELAEPIVYGDAKPGSMQGPRYTTLSRIRSARQINELTA